MKIWDAANGKEITTLKGHTGWVNAVAFSPDGVLLASASCDKTVRFWDAKSGREVRVLKGHAGSVVCLAFSADGKRLASGGGAWDAQKKSYISGELKVWDVAGGRETFSLQGLGQWVSSVAFSPDGQRIASTRGDPDHPDKPGEVNIWDAATGQEMVSLRKQTAFVTGVAFSPDGRQLVSAGYDRTVQVWNTK